MNEKSKSNHNKWGPRLGWPYLGGDVRLQALRHCRSFDPWGSFYTTGSKQTYIHYSGMNHLRQCLNIHGKDVYLRSMATTVFLFCGRRLADQ